MKNEITINHLLRGAALLMLVSGLIFFLLGNNIGFIFLCSAFLFWIVSGQEYEPFIPETENEVPAKTPILETERTILRPWNKDDAEELYKYASDPRVGPIAGWAVHENVEQSRNIIETVFSAPFTYAIVLKETNKPVGSIGLLFEGHSETPLKADEAEIGYWIGVPYWGQGLVPEALNELVNFSFTKLGINTLWCGYYNDNVKSKRVQEKCGFKYDHSEENHYCEQVLEYRTAHMTNLTKNEWKTQPTFSCTFIDE